MQEKLPLISVITVVYNGFTEIEKTIQSVITQSYQAVEYIIIDGGSIDGTIDIIKKYEDKVRFWSTEPDKGIYDAMNKGIDHANGLYTIFVNSGDYLYDHAVFDKLLSTIKDFSGYDMIYGRSKIIKPNGDITDLVIKHSCNQLWKGPCFRHGALFARTSLLKQYKFELSERLKIAADLDFIYKVYKNGYTFKEVDLVIVAFKEEGVSNNPYMHIRDSIHVVKKYGDWSFKKSCFYLFKYLKLFIRLSIFRYIYKFLRVFFQDYFSNYWINKVPFFYIRHQYYKRVMGIKIGKGSSIHLKCFVYGTNVQIAENSTINRNCYLDGRGKLFIGNKVSISPEVQLITEDHDYNSVNFAGRSRDVIIEDYVWIGTRAIILPGVHIGKGAVVCAGAVVTKNIGEFEVVAGVPAVKIKDRSRNLDYNPSWLPYFG